MTVRFTSPRQAVETYVAARSRGPSAAAPRWDGMPRSGNYSPADDAAWVAVGAMLYGPAPDGCAIEKDSTLERMLFRWAAGLGEYTPAIKHVERKLLIRLRRAGLMPQATRWVRTEEVDDDGRRFTRHTEVVLPDDSPAAEP